MIVTDTIKEVRTTRWKNPVASWGLVPTMGYLHEGHLSLVRRAKAENQFVAATIFVNPTQFAPHEDLATYPRNLAGDLAMLEAEGVDLVFTPNNATIYPTGYQTYVTVEQLTQFLEGAARPLFFRGVATVVTKLFNIVQPTRAYFGQKDAQQTVVVRRMVEDLNIPTEIIVCPTMREADGVAMSSRNSYLSADERIAASVLFRALWTAQAMLEKGVDSAETIRHAAQTMIEAEPLAQLEYLSIAHPTLLHELEKIEGELLISLAVKIGRTRLIDNLLWPTLSLTEI